MRLGVNLSLHFYLPPLRFGMSEYCIEHNWSSHRAGCPACNQRREPTNPISPDPYAVTIGGVIADPYRIARAFQISDPVIFQAVKKLLRSGRKHKDLAQDVREAITSLERWEAMNLEDQTS